MNYVGFYDELLYISIITEFFSEYSQWVKLFFRKVMKVFRISWIRTIDFLLIIT